MARIPERRHVARITIPSELSDPGLRRHQMRLIDLSSQGARVENIRSFPNRRMCFLDLPPPLGETRLQGEVIWSQEVGHKPRVAGNRVMYYQSGLTFRGLTSEQRAGLAAALDILRAAHKA